MNQIEMNYTVGQKYKINNWKDSLSIRKSRQFIPCFSFNKKTKEGYSLYHLNIVTDDTEDGSVYVGGEFGF